MDLQKLSVIPHVAWVSDKHPPGGRHDNDHVNFRDVRITPTVEEINCEVRPYLPLASKENRLENMGDDTSYLLDSQFRLLREDFLSTTIKESNGTWSNSAWSDSNICLFG